MTACCKPRPWSSQLGGVLVHMGGVPVYRGRQGRPGDRREAAISGTEELRQGTKSLRSGPLRGGVSRELGSEPIG